MTDTRRKRSSVAGLALAFLGSAIVPDGALSQQDRQAVGNGYYGIDAGSAFVEIGGTAQLTNAYASTGGITLERIIGGTSQVQPYTSSAVITLERILGGSSQLGVYGSSGGITVGDAVEEETLSGGFFFDYDREMYRRKKEERKRQELEEAAKQIQDEIDQQLALEFRKKEKEQQRINELQRLTRLAEKHEKSIRKEFSNDVIIAAERAVKQGNYDAMEALERRLRMAKEEEEFIIQAFTMIYNNA